LVSLYSTIKMMHGPINIRQTYYLLHWLFPPSRICQILSVEFFGPRPFLSQSLLFKSNGGFLSSQGKLSLKELKLLVNEEGGRIGFNDGVLHPKCGTKPRSSKSLTTEKSLGPLNIQKLNPTYTARHDRTSELLLQWITTNS